MNLKTKRLELTPITNKDLDVFHNTNTNPFVKKYLWDNQDIPKLVSIDILNKTETKFKTEKWGLWKIINLDNEEYMGYIGFWSFLMKNCLSFYMLYYQNLLEMVMQLKLHMKLLIMPLKSYVLNI